MRMVIALAADLSDDPAVFLDLLHRLAWGDDLETLEPGMLAQLDQHSAAVRDSIGPGAGRLEIGDLAGYARGIAVVSSGWDWSVLPAETHQWVHLRLASVCCLARDLGHLLVPSNR